MLFTKWIAGVVIIAAAAAAVYIAVHSHPIMFLISVSEPLMKVNRIRKWSAPRSLRGTAVRRKAAPTLSSSSVAAVKSRTLIIILIIMVDAGMARVIIRGHGGGLDSSCLAPSGYSAAMKRASWWNSSKKADVRLRTTTYITQRHNDYCQIFILSAWCDSTATKREMNVDGVKKPMGILWIYRKRSL